MLYPQNKEPVLSDALFCNPGSPYRGTPFWAWNCELDQNELLQQLDILKQMGMGGAHMHVRTGMTTPYLSDAHMALIKACVEKCREENLLAWLYDEDRWPSGAAGGLVTKDPQYRARHLLFTVEPYGQKKTVDNKAINYSSSAASRSENGQLLACYDIVLDKSGCLKRGVRIRPEINAEGTKWYVYLETPNPNPWFNNQTYINTLDPAAIRRFIEVTYERYWEIAGKDFGGVIPAIFTDEPQFTHKQSLGFATEQSDVILPWTDDVPQTFLEAYGEDLMERLPELLWDLPGGQISQIRYHYHDHIAERFAQAFADQCGNWCQAHGLMLTGHMMEEPTLESQTAALGDAMRSYRSFQLPGIDMLCNRIEFTTAKQAQSAARQYGREGVASELYGVTGWDFDFRGHKFQGDWQAALGVTVRVHHLAWVSMKGEAKRDYPASINYQSPWWQDYSLVEDHFARLNTAMTRGTPLVRVGVIHPVESYWLHWGPKEQTEGIRSQIDKNFQNVTSWLLEGGIDFDFISESLLPLQCAKGGAPLQVGAMAYDTILIPGCETLRSSTLERLEAFQQAGGRLIFLGDAAKYENAVPSTRASTLLERSAHASYEKEAILAAVEPARLVDIRNEDGSRTSNLIHQLRQDSDSRWLFIAHSRKPYNKDVPTCQQIRITLDGEYSVMKYDTQTGIIEPMVSEVVSGKTVVIARLYDLDSLLLRYTPPVSAGFSPLPQTDERPVALPVPARVKFTLDEPNVYLLDKAEFALDDEAWRPAQELLRADNMLRKELGWPSREEQAAQPWTVQAPQAGHTVRLRFTVFSALALSEVTLALEDAGVSKIFCNGNPITAVPNGWFTDRSIRTVSLGSLNKGENRIEIQLPYGERTDLEWCYLLGNFGVQVFGEYRELTALPQFLGFDDVTHQGLAHYGSNITYHLPVITQGGKLRVTVPHYAGTALRVELEDQKEYIAYPPYRLEIDELEAGAHTLKLTLLGNRQNCFGPVHQADEKDCWIGPNVWRTTGNSWTDSYRLKPLGLLSAPRIEEIF